MIAKKPVSAGNGNPPIFNYQPMLATDASQPPRAKHFDFEIKFDGFRCGLSIEKGGMRLISRQGTIFTSWFPELAELGADIAGTNALVDGEIIVGSGSVESFNILLRRARLRGRSIKEALPVSFVAFDVLWHDGVDWTQRPLTERREHLRTIVTESKRIAVSRVFTDGPALLSIVAAHGLEGIIAKDRRSLYEPGSAIAGLAQDKGIRRLQGPRLERDGAKDNSLASLVIRLTRTLLGLPDR